MSEVTAAFGLAEGSLTTVDDYDTFQCFKKSYALSDKIDVPYYLKDLQVTTPTLRSQFTMLGLRGLTGASTWKIHEDYFMEIFAGGCTQEPMDPTSKATIDFVAANDPTNTTQNICGTSGNQFIGQWSLRGFVDDRTVLVQFSFPGNLFIGFTKTYMTDFALLTIADHETYEDAFTMTFKGPSAGDYAGFNTTDVDAGPFQSNIGEVQVDRWVLSRVVRKEQVLVLAQGCRMPEYNSLRRSCSGCPQTENLYRGFQCRVRHRSHYV